MDLLNDSTLNDLLSSLKPDETPEDTPLPSLTEPTEHSEPQEDASIIRIEAEDGLWTRQSGETKRAYACFCAYRDLGPSRTLLAAYRQKTGKKTAKQSSGHWNAWYRKHEWKQRAEAYDAHLDHQKRQAEAEKWRERGEALVEEQFRLAQAMMEKARQMLKFPLAEQTVKKKDRKGHPVEVTVEPAKWTFNSAARMAKVAIELARLATGLPTKNEQSVHFEIDPSNLTDEQIERIRNGEHPAAVVASANQGDPSPG